MGVGEMQMEGASAPATDEPNLDVTAESPMDSDALDQSMAPCTHCLIHSQTASGPISVGAINNGEQSAKTKAASSAPVSLPPVIVVSVSPTGHAPPDGSSPCQLLIGVLRI